MKNENNIPSWLDIGGLGVSVIETADLNVFGRDTRYGKIEVPLARIWIRKDMDAGVKWLVFFHEVREYCAEFFGMGDYTHEDIQRFDMYFYWVLVRNKFNFSKMFPKETYDKNNKKINKKTIS